MAKITARDPYAIYGGYEGAADAVTLAVWEMWTKNGLNLSEEECEERLKTVRDHVANCWVDDISIAEWQAHALRSLEGE